MFLITDKTYETARDFVREITQRMLMRIRTKVNKCPEKKILF